MGASQSNMDMESKRQDSIDKKQTASGYKKGHKMSGYDHKMSGHEHSHEHSHLHAYGHKMSASDAKSAVKGMSMRKCKVDPKLASQKGRKSPPIKADQCKVGSVARGLDGKMYVNSGKRWTAACKSLSDAAVARLEKPKRKASPKRMRKAASPKRMRKAASPKRKVKKTPAKTPKRKPRKTVAKKK